MLAWYGIGLPVPPSTSRVYQSRYLNIWRRLIDTPRIWPLLRMLCDHQTSFIRTAMTRPRSATGSVFSTNIATSGMPKAAGRMKSGLFGLSPTRTLAARIRPPGRCGHERTDILNMKILAPFEKRAGRPLDILDFGAGNGWMSYRLSLRGHRARSGRHFQRRSRRLGREELPQTVPAD